PKSIGFARMVVCDASSGAVFCNPAGNVMPKPDLRLTASITDVKCASNLPIGQSACPSAGADYNPNTAAGPYTDGGDGSNTPARPPCFPSGISDSSCIAGTDLTETAELAGAQAGGSGSFRGTGLRITDTMNGPGQDEPAT